MFSLPDNPQAPDRPQRKEPAGSRVSNDFVPAPIISVKEHDLDIDGSGFWRRHHLTLFNSLLTGDAGMKNGSHRVIKLKARKTKIRARIPFVQRISAKRIRDKPIFVTRDRARGPRSPRPDNYHAEI